MGHRTIAIIQTLGSGGDLIGQMVAEQLGIGYVDREVFERAAAAAGVSVETIQEADKVPSFLSRMIELLGRYPVTAELLGPSGDLPQVPNMTSDNYRTLIEDVIRGIADSGDNVIIGHGAQFVLAGRRNVLRVFVTAPLEARIARIMATEGCSAEDATRLAQENIAMRRDFYQQYYKANWNEAQYYDICLRTDKLTLEDCAGLLIQAVGRITTSDA